jgi:hypothetical protein
MSYYDIEYIAEMIRQAADFAEIEKDFISLRKWIYELENTIEEMKKQNNKEKK